MLQLDRFDTQASVEVLPPLRERRRGLSDESVSRILELVWRDTRTVASEYRFGDVLRTLGYLVQGSRAPTKQAPPFVYTLVSDRLPLLRWYVHFKAEQTALSVASSLASASLAPQAMRHFETCRAECENRVTERRDQLWPVLRTLLLTQDVHRRVVRAAQTQILRRYGGDPAAARKRSVLASMLQSPQRLVRLWCSAVGWAFYAARWVLNEFGLRWVLSKQQRERVRTELIERAIERGVELQRSVERIEEEAARQQATAALETSPVLWQLWCTLLGAAPEGFGSYQDLATRTRRAVGPRV